MNKPVFFGEEYSYLIPLLLTNRGTGYVHSIFANGFNLQIADSLIFIGNKKSGRLPFGIHLPDEVIGKAVSWVTNREAVYWNQHSDELSFNKFSISLREGKSFKNEIITIKNKLDIQTALSKLRLLLAVIGEPCGLSFDMESFLQKLEAVHVTDMLEVEHNLLWLMEAVTATGGGKIEKVLRYFIGRGKGLTPSGDDLLVGLLAFCTLANIPNQKFKDKISELIENELITTDVSREYLRYALRNEFSSTVTDLLNSLAGMDSFDFKKACIRLLQVGHSSGLDTLYGILMGMLTFIREDN